MNYDEAVEKLRRLWDMGFADTTVQYDLYVAYKSGVKSIPRLAGPSSKGSDDYLMYKSMKVRTP